MGEIIDKYSDQKEYGLVNSQSRLLAGFPDKASRKVLNYLEGKQNIQTMVSRTKH